MGFLLWFLLAVMDGARATLWPRQVSPCNVVQEDVYCNDMNLKTIPEQLPPDIYKLDLSNNLLQNLTMEHMALYTNVHQLNLHDNKIDYIQPGLFKDMTKLQELDLSRNYLDIFAGSKTEIGPLTAVQKLDLSGNGLYTDMTDYFLHDAPSLLNLSLDGNSITKIGKLTFSGSKALKNIDLHNNIILEIEEGAFDFLQDLTALDLSMNSITCITDFNLSQLKLLNLSKNSMESFQTIASELEYELLYLDLRENKIHYFPVLPKNNKVIYIDISRNLLRGVNTTAVDEELTLKNESNQNDYNNLSKLIYLDMSYNQIKSIPLAFLTSMRSVEALNLSNNCLEAFSMYHNCTLSSLKTLDLSFNALQNVSFGECTLWCLEELNLKSNDLSSLDPCIFYRLPKIRNLHLQGNDLSICGSDRKLSHKKQQVHTNGCVFFSYIRTLHYLYLSDNSVKSVPQYAFYESPLRVLDLSHNTGMQLDKNAFIGLETSLTHLSLKGNDLEVLLPDLSLLVSLRSVDLSNNKLTTLPLWNTKSKIEILNLQNNNLVTLEYNTVLVLEKTLKTLYLGSNPLNCCGNPRFLYMIQKPSVNIPDIASVMCKYTQDFEHFEINLASMEQKLCDNVDRKSMGIIIIIITSLVLLVVLVLLSKVCHPRRNRLRRSFRA